MPLSRLFYLHVFSKFWPQGSVIPIGGEGIFVREFLVHAKVARSEVLGKTVAVVLRREGRVRYDRAGRRVAGVELSALGKVDVLVAPVNEQIGLENHITLPIKMPFFDSHSP